MTMISKCLLLFLAMSSVCFAARIKRPESLTQYDSLQAEHASYVEANFQKAKKAAESVGVESSRLPTGNEKQEFVDIHNKYRCMHGAEDVKWSDAMAESAHNYISQMTSMQHSDSYSIPAPAGPAGENLYMASWAATPSQAVDAWYSEVNDCQGGPTGFSDGCARGVNGAVTGHFTVMVWTGVKEIGCAFSDAKAGLIICRYKAGDRLSTETPNMNKGSGNYVSHVLVRSRTAEQCGAGADSGNDGKDDGSSNSGDADNSDDADVSGPVDYEHCVAEKSVGQCGQCTHTSQCGNSNDGRSQFCCPYMKKCVPDGSTGCNYPIATCRPPCHERNSEAKCKCSNDDYPTTWLGKTCGKDGAGAGGGSVPTPAPATPAPPTTGPIDYEHCIPEKSVGQCGQCTHHSQCGNSNDGRSQFCCPYLKKCVPDSSTGCYQPIASCRPPCHERNSEAKCVCSNTDYPTNWLGKTCGSNSDPQPTPAPTAPPTPRPTAASTPVPTSPPATDDCKDTRSHCSHWAGLGYCNEGHKYRPFMHGNCAKSCGVCTPAQDSPTPAPPTPAPTAPPTDDASTRRLKMLLAGAGVNPNNYELIERLTAWKITR